MAAGAEVLDDGRMSTASTLPPPTGPAAPPPSTEAVAPPPAPPVLTARWLGLLGGGLVAVASLIVGFGGRELLGAYGPAAGLTGAAAASWFASTRMRTAAPVVAAVLSHLARLVAAIAAAAVVAGSTSWTAVPAAAGVAAGVASFGWRLGGRWARTALQTVAVGGVAMSVAAETVLPLGVLLAVAGTIAIAGVPTRRGGRFTDVGGLLAGLALLAPLGGLPGRWRLGPGTLARLGLRGDVLDWAAPSIGVLAGAALVVVAGRHRSHLLARLALVAAVANVAIGLGWNGWEPVRPTTYIALVFAVVQVAVAAVQTADRFWARVVAPLAPVMLIIGWALALGLTIEVLGVTLVGGVERTLPVAPALVGIGFLVGRFDPVGRAPFEITATGMTLLTVFASTGSATATAATGVLMAAGFTALRTGAALTLTTATTAAVLTFTAQLADESFLPDGLAVALLALCVFAIGRNSGERIVLPLGAAVVFGAAVDVRSILEWTTLYAGVTATALVATRRTTTLGAAALPATLGCFALGGLVDAVTGTHRIDAVSTPVAIALSTLVGVGLAGWWRGERLARHVVAASVVAASACWAVAGGADAAFASVAVLVGGIALSGAAFTRRRFGAADTASLAALAWASAYGFAGGDQAIGWGAVTALGVVVTLHGLCFVDFSVAGAGAGIALFGAVGLAGEVDAASRLGDALRDVGVSGADVAMLVVVVVMAAWGVVISIVDRSASSWVTWGPASATGGAYLLVSIAANDAPDTRLLVALTGAIALVVAGALRRSAAPLVIGTATVVGAVTLASWTTLRSLPGWVWIGAGGVLLLTIGAAVERRGHADGDESEHQTVRRILTSFR